MFRGKESSNRIELSRLVQDLLNFGVLGSLRLWGWGGWMDGVGVVGGWMDGVGVVGGCPHTCAHAHAHMHMLNMIISCKWPPPLRESLGIPYDIICVCACMHVHVHMCGGTLSLPPTPIHPPSHPHLPTPHPHPPTPHSPGGTPRISQNSIALELIEIFQFCLKI